MAEAYAMVSLVEQGWANQNDVAQAFGCSARTVRRDQRRFEERRPGCAGTAVAAIPKAQSAPFGENAADGFSASKPAGHSNREIARRARRQRNGHSQIAALRLGWKGAAAQQPDLIPFEIASACEPKPVRFLLLPAKSHRLPAMTPIRVIVAPTGCWRDLGLLEDAPPLFGSATAVPRAGVLLALPVLVASGVFECAQKIYGSLGPASMDCAPVCSRCC